MKVLIADDDPVWRKLLTQNVKKWGYEVIEAEDGRQAWNMIQEHRAPRIALLDEVDTRVGATMSQRTRISKVDKAKAIAGILDSLYPKPPIPLKPHRNLIGIQFL